jgi:hypothetical protein
MTTEHANFQSGFTIVPRISVSARINPRTARVLRNYGFEIDQFEELSEPTILTGEVIEGARGGRCFLGLDDSNIIIILDKGRDDMVAIGTKKNRR